MKANHITQDQPLVQALYHYTITYQEMTRNFPGKTVCLPQNSDYVREKNSKKQRERECAVTKRQATMAYT